MNIIFIVLVLILILISDNLASGSQSKSGKKVASAKVTIPERNQHVLHFEFCSS